MKRFFGISLFVLIASMMLARTPQEAANIASQFINQSHSIATQRIQRAATTAMPVPVDLVYTHYQVDNTTPAVYVFNSQDTESFVLVSAEDNARTILGYSDCGTFDQTDIPENMQFWLTMYANELARIHTQQSSVSHSKRVGGAINAPLPTIEPILGEVVWGQSQPFYNLCPVINGERSVTGCVATAISQIMYAHKYPVKGTGNASYSLSNGMRISEDFSRTTYDWEHMIPNYNKQYTEQEATAVATLMYHVGVASRMSYSPQASGAVSVWALQALNRHFGYDADIKVTVKDHTPEYEILSGIAEDLLAGMPVYVSGRTIKDEGHAFVCDGIHPDGYIHINWGWNGVGNGFFAISALDPGQQGVGGSSSNLAFTEDVTFYTNIRPDQGGKPTPAVYAIAEQISAHQLSRGEKVSFMLHNVSNAGTADAIGKFGFYIYDSQDQLVDESIVYKNLRLPSGYIYTQLEVSANIASKLTEGTYYMVIAHKDANETIHPVLIHSQGYPKYTFTLTQDSIYFGSNELQMPDTLQADFINLAGTNQWQMDLYSTDFWDNTTATDQWLVRCTLNCNSATSIIGSYLLDKKNTKTPSTISLAGAVCAIGNVTDCKQYTPNQLQLTITQTEDLSIKLQYLLEFNGQTFTGDIQLSQIEWYQLIDGIYQDYSSTISFEPATPLKASQSIDLSKSYFGTLSTSIPYLIEGSIAAIHQTPDEILAQQYVDLEISDDGDNKYTLQCSALQWLDGREWTTGNEIHASDRVILLGTLSFKNNKSLLEGHIYQHDPVTHLPITSFDFNTEGLKMTATWQSEAPYFKVRLYDKKGKVIADNIINKQTITATLPTKDEYTFYLRPMQQDKVQFAGAAKIITFIAGTSTNTETIEENAYYDIYDVMGNKFGFVSKTEEQKLQNLPKGIYILVGKSLKKIFIP